MKKCVIIYNPNSGKLSKKRNLTMFSDIFKKYGYEMRMITTSCKGDAIDIMKKLSDVDLVISAGGDGTLNEVITGNLKRKKQILQAHLPFGTMNDVARMYGLSQNIYKNLEMILNGVEKNIDVCLINDATFVYIACIGAYVDISYATPRKLKEKYGRLGYVLYGIKQVSKQKFKYYNVKYSINGVEYKRQVSFIFLTNSTGFAGMPNVFDDIKLNDNKFEILMCNIKNKWDLIKALYYLKRREINNMPGFIYYKTDNIDFEFEESPSSWCIDGDELVDKGKKFSVRVTREIKMLLPKKNVDKLFEKEK